MRRHHREDAPIRHGSPFAPPLIRALFVAAGAGLNLTRPLPFLPAAWLDPLFWTLIVIAAALGVWGRTSLRRHGTAILPNRPATTIVETGPYRFTRNPMYVGQTVAILAIAARFDNLWLVILLAAWFPAMHYGVIAREERYLEAKFGEAYTRYKARVRRWI